MKLTDLSLAAVILLCASCASKEYVTPVIYPDLPSLPWTACRTLPATGVNYVSATLNGEAWMPAVDTIISGKDTAYKPIVMQPFDVQVYYSGTFTTEDDLIAGGQVVRTTLRESGPFSVDVKELSAGTKYHYVAVLDAYSQRRTGGVVSFSTLPVPEGAVDLGGPVFWAASNYGTMSWNDISSSPTSPWMLPTNSRLQYLFGGSACRMEKVSEGEIKGYRVSNRESGESIFLPLCEDGTLGYWSGNAGSGADSACFMTTDSLGCVLISERPREDILPVRLVMEKY